jgi:hypothetical protein
MSVASIISQFLAKVFETEQWQRMFKLLDNINQCDVEVGLRPLRSGLCVVSREGHGLS